MGYSLNDDLMNRVQMTDKVRQRIIISIIAVGLLVGIGLNIYQFFRFGIYAYIDVSDTVIHGSDEYSWNVDSMTERNDSYQISGWIVRKCENIDTYNIQLIIVNEESSCLVPTAMVSRTDVTESLNSDGKAYDYDASGFTTTINKRYVQSKHSKLYILYQNNKHYEIVDIDTDFENAE